MEVQIKDLLPTRNLIILSDNDTVADALTKFNQNRISSAPVIGYGGKHDILGFVDVLDLLTFLVKVSTKTLTTTSYGESRSLTTDDMRLIMKRNKDFKVSAVRDLIDLSRRNPFHRVRQDTSVRDIIRLFSQGIHRVAVMDVADERLIGVLSQSDVMKFVLSNMDKFSGFKGDREMSKISFMTPTNNMVSVKDNIPAIDAFLKMHENGISAISIVDNNNNLIGTLSASDLKMIDVQNDFNILIRPLREFTSDLRKAQKKSENFMVACPPNSTLRDAMKMMSGEHVHRIFVVDNNKKATGVVSLTDFFKDISQSVITPSSK